MCRLLGYVAGGDRSPTEVVGSTTLARFRALARVHRDGWGAAWSTPDGVRTRRSTTPALEDDGFDEHVRDARGPAGLLHLRWATPGLEVMPQNTHPFSGDGWAMAHNGSVPDSKKLLDLLPDRHRAALRGTTDSERFFRLVLARAEEGGDLLQALRSTAATVLDLVGPVSINTLWLSRTRMLAVHGLGGARPPVAELLAAHPGPGGLPPDHTGSYFRLAHRRTDQGLLVMSSGLPRAGWTDFTPDTVLDVDLTTGATTWHDLLDDDVAADRGAWSTGAASLREPVAACAGACA